MCSAVTRYFVLSLSISWRRYSTRRRRKYRYLVLSRSDLWVLCFFSYLLREYETRALISACSDLFALLHSVENVRLPRFSPQSGSVWHRIHALTATTRFLVSSLAGGIGGDNSIFSCKSHINTLGKQDRVHARKEQESCVKSTITSSMLRGIPNSFDGRI